jgi:hypothetical protein
MDDAEGIGRSLEEHVARAAGTRQRLSDELRDLVVVEQEIYDGLKAQADEAKARRDGYQRALDHIEGATKAAAAKPSKPARSKRDWMPSDEKVEQVWAKFREVWAERPEPMTHTALGRGLPLGADTVGKAFEVLRDRELIRVAGTARGGGKLWAPMPASREERLTVAA